MSEQTPAGWYPDPQGTTRYWDGTAWTEYTHEPTGGVPSPAGGAKNGAFAKLRKAASDRSADRRGAREAEARERAAAKNAAGALVTSGTFGLSTVEIYEGGFVRVTNLEQSDRPSIASARAQMAANLRGGGMSPDAPYEKLRSITFAPSNADQLSSEGTGLDSALGPAAAGLLKGTRNLMRTSAPGLAAAGFAHVASQASRTSHLTIATDRRIYTLSNQIPNSVGLKTAQKGHVDVGKALVAAAEAVLGIHGASSTGAPSAPPPAQPEAPEPAKASLPSLSVRLRELADLHQEGILSDEEFTSAKTKLLGEL